MISEGLPCTILIGPEGDFTDEELANAKRCGYKEVNISDTRLRAETAGIVALNTVAIRNRSSFS